MALRCSAWCVCGLQLESLGQMALRCSTCWVCGLQLESLGQMALRCSTCWVCGLQLESLGQMALRCSAWCVCGLQLESLGQMALRCSAWCVCGLQLESLGQMALRCSAWCVCGLQLESLGQMALRCSTCWVCGLQLESLGQMALRCSACWVCGLQLESLGQMALRCSACWVCGLQLESLGQMALRCSAWCVCGLQLSHNSCRIRKTESKQYGWMDYRRNSTFGQCVEYRRHPVDARFLIRNRQVVDDIAKKWMSRDMTEHGSNVYRSKELDAQRLKSQQIYIYCIERKYKYVCNMSCVCEEQLSVYSSLHAIPVMASKRRRRANTAMPMSLTSSCDTEMHIWIMDEGDVYEQLYKQRWQAD